MIKKLNILLIFVFPVMVFSQTGNTLTHNNFLFGANAGLNVSKLGSDSLEFNYGTKPYIGLYGRYKALEKLFIKTSILYSLKGSNSISPYVKFENQYLDLNFTPQYEVFDDFYIQAGVSYSEILSSKEIVNIGDNWNGIEKNNIGGYNSEMNFLTGIEFKLQNNVAFEINYTIASKESNTSNFQFGLNILLNNRTKEKPSYRKIKKQKSKEQIKQLKNSVLLVRLRTSSNTIAALRKIGKKKKAEKIKNQQIVENKKIVEAFRKNFDYCEVRFFYNNNSISVRKNKFENIFLNDSLQIDRSINIDRNKNFFIAEFSGIEQDTMKYFSHSSYEPSENGGLKIVHNYYSPSSDIDFYALRIMDNNFVQLNKPFPYYTRAIYKSMKNHPEQLVFLPPIYMIFLNWSYDKTVFRMNKKFRKYYNRNN